ncbi:MAG TPA: PQQ-binding-like beta-propeller repeat protein [Thermoanaerobaculia bacterium]|nr:PQQ-binding-like beta-propeller repeat protein [Thermoanaerobaculia bacterium]
MRSPRLLHPSLLALLLLAPAPAPAGVEIAAATRWPSFRGERAQGVADGQGLPVRWDPRSGENVRWKAEIPGLGHSSPVVWDRRVFVATAVPEQAGERPQPLLGDTGGIEMAEVDRSYRWLVMAFDAATGARAWEAEVARGVPRAPHHVKASQANATPATDGETVVAALGSEGLFALDAETGTVRWRVDLGVNDPGLFGDPRSHWGAASSPVIWRDRVFMQVDRHADSFLAAYRLSDGAELWRLVRDEMPVWATPTVHTVDGRDELIVVGGRTVRGIDPGSGDEVWRFADFAEVKTPTPLAVDGAIVLSGGYRGRPLFALRPGGRGDLTVPLEEAPRGHLAWATDRGGPYTATPVAYRGLLFSVRNTGVLAVYDLETGERRARVRLDDTYSASPVASDGRVYLAGENGSVTVMTAASDPVILATVEMGEPILATPGIAGGALFLRTVSSLVAVADLATASVPAADEGGGAGEVARARALLGAARDALKPTPDLVLVGEGHQDLAVRYQGVRPVPGGGRRPYREVFVVDDERRRLGWDVHARRPDDSEETLRFVYLGDDQLGFFHRLDGLAAWSRDPSAGATRRRLERRLPHRILEAALAPGATILGSAMRTLPDGSRSRRVGVELADGEPLALFVEEAGEGGPPRVRAVASAAELPIRGVAEVVWLFHEERDVEGLGRIPGGYTLWIGEEPLRRVEYTTIRRGAAASDVFETPEGLREPTPPPPPPTVEPADRGSAFPRVRELHPGVHLVQHLRGGFHALVVDLGAELLVVDAPTGWVELDEIPPATPDRPVDRGLAEDLLAAARAAAPGKPVRWLALTHFHADHAGGFLPFVEAGATVIASAPTLSLLRAVAERELSDPSLLRVREVSGRATVEGSARSVELVEVEANPHAEGLLVVHLPSARVLWVADLVRPQRDGRIAPPSERHLAEFFGRWLRASGLQPAEILAPHMAAIAGAEQVAALLAASGGAEEER